MSDGKSVHDGDDDALIGGDGEEGNSPVGAVSTANHHFVATPHPSLIQQDLKFEHLGGHLAVGIACGAIVIC